MLKPSRKTQKSFWANGLSVDETKFSVFIVMFILSVGLSLYFFANRIDIFTNHLRIIETLIYAIAGINIADRVSAGIENRKKIDEAYQSEHRKENY